MQRNILQNLSGIVSVCLLAAAPISAQSSLPANTSTALAEESPAPQEPTKKVWTNEDVTGLRNDTAISTFSGANAKTAATTPKTAKSRSRDANWYHGQIARLQAQVPPLDDQIAALQAALDGKPTGDQQTSKRPYGVKSDSWTAQRDDLTKKRDGILAQIDSLRDEARHNGIPDSALP